MKRVAQLSCLFSGVSALSAGVALVFLGGWIGVFCMVAGVVSILVALKTQ